MDAPNMAEILIVNGIGVFLMLRLFIARSDGLESHFPWERLFSAMIWLTTLGCSLEALSFVIDGKQFPLCRELNYVLNSICFLSTCTVGYLWCLFVDFRTFNSPRRVRKSTLFLSLPLILQVIVTLINLSGNGILFSVSEQNVYRRGSLVSVPYLILFFYFLYSLHLTDISKKNGLHLKTLSASSVVIPCTIGTIVQGMCYGITLGWTAVAISLVHIYQQTQFLNFFTDSLSMLYNRRYLDRILQFISHNAITNVYGVMIDVNDFKHINDAFGHAAGDRAIRHIARILSKSIPDSGLAIRYAGDEFILLLRAEEPSTISTLICSIEKEVDAWNQSQVEPYPLSFAMGYSQFDITRMTVDEFLTDMDRRMYDNKHAHYEKHGRKGFRETSD